MYYKQGSHRNVLAFFLGLIFLMSDCRGQPVNFQLTQTGHTETLETKTLEVDNCNGFVEKSYTYRYPYSGNAVGVENLIPNGSEPFVSIRKRILNMYGEQATKVRLSVPSRTRREFTILITKVKYRGIVNGEIIEENKIISGQEAIYFYPFTESIHVETYRDVPCP